MGGKALVMSEGSGVSADWDSVRMCTGDIRTRDHFVVLMTRQMELFLDSGDLWTGAEE